MNFKEVVKKTWWFIWESNSPASWAADIALVFILVKFVIFPLLGLALSTSLPLVVVESSSMEHLGYDFDGWWQHFGEWYDQANITKANAESWHFRNGIDKGDIIVVKGSKNYTVGQVIVFKREAKTPVIHRLVYFVDADTISTKGDKNPYQISEEKEVAKELIFGKAVARIPKLGWIKLAFVELLKKR